MELRREYDALLKERAGLDDLLGSPRLQWLRIAEELAAVQVQFGKGTALGARRTRFAEAGEAEDVPIEAMIDREPITVICSRMGWIRAMKGHQPLDAEVKYKDGDEARFLFHAETTDRLMLAGSNGRFFTVMGANLPGGRGMGEPVRLMVDLPNDADIAALAIWRPETKLILASTAGEGFVVPAEDVLAQTRAGRQVMNLAEGERLAVVRPVAGDHVAVISKNRKLICFALSEVPELSRGKGVRLQKYLNFKGDRPLLERDGGLSDLITFRLAEGLTWTTANGQTRRETAIGDWVARRGGIGKAPPHGFPRDNRFT
jgi:topoisomerase-4 subunit A